MACPYSKTVDGFENQFGTNHLGHFLFTTLLLPALKKGAPSRVVNVSSVAHKRSRVILDDLNFEKRPYNKWQAYGQSKAANISFTVELHRRFSSQGITALALHPGGIFTGLQKDISKEEQAAMGWLDENGKQKKGFKTIDQGASTSVWAATSPDLEGKGGIYLEDCTIASPATKETPFKGYAPYAYDPEVAKKLWEISERLVATTAAL